MASKQELLKAVLDALRARTGREPKPSTGGWWVCQCPAHEDSEPSLSILPGDRGIVLKCFAGCAPDAVADALGLDLADLFYEDRTRDERGRSSCPSSVRSSSDDLDGPAPTPHPEGSAGNQDNPDGPLTVAALAEAKSVAPELLKALGCEETGGAVQIPYFYEDGRRAPRTRIRKAISGKKRWAWTANDGEIIPYGLQRLEDARKAGELIIVEGESDCWNLWEAGFPALGMPGANTCLKLLPEYVRGLERIWISREGDKAGGTFAVGIASRLAEIGFEGEVRILTCGAFKDPAEMRGHDRAGFVASFRERMRKARRPESAPVEYTAGSVADLFLREGRDLRVFGSAEDDPGEQRILYYRGLFYRYTGRAYEAVSDGEMAAQLAQFIRGRMWVSPKGAEVQGSPTRAFVGNVQLALAGQGCVPTSVNLPVWRSGEQASRMLILRNGILDIDGVMRYLDVLEQMIASRCVGEGEADPRLILAEALRPHSPDLFSVVELPFEWRGETGCPKWRAFLNRVLPDVALQKVLQEWFGYCLVPSQAYQRLLIMQGEGANGKSVAMGVLKNLIGERNWSAVPLEALDKNHMLKPLEGKLVNFSTEWTHIESAAINLLKAISGGDPVHINPKNRDGYDLLLPTRFVITTNDPPRLSDRTEAIWRRLLTVPFTVTIPVEERRPLDVFVTDLCGEMPGILMWSLEGLHRLMRQGAFADCAATEALKAEYREDARPEFVFLEERVQLKPGEALRTDALYEAYQEYCRDGGYKPLHATRFGREFVRWFRHHEGRPPRRERMPMDMAGKRAWAYADATWAEGA